MRGYWGHFERRSGVANNHFDRNVALGGNAQYDEEENEWIYKTALSYFTEDDKVWQELTISSNRI